MRVPLRPGTVSSIPTMESRCLEEVADILRDVVREKACYTPKNLPDGRKDLLHFGSMFSALVRTRERSCRIRSLASLKILGSPLNLDPQNKRTVL